MATQPPGDEQIRQRLDSSITGLDDHRTENLKRTRLLQANKDDALKKEQARLHKKYGADHPRVAKITKRLDYNRAALPELETEVERSQIKVPEFDANTWMVHGRVLNRKFTGIKGLTLALYDADGKVEKRLNFACTDERGYYAIRYQAKASDRLSIDPKTDYYLTVSDGKGHVCHKEEEPLKVVIGQTDYRLIVLDGATCTPPPGWCEGEGDGDDDDGDGDNGEAGEWVVAGTVIHANNKPGTGLVVSMVDKKEKKVVETVNTGRTGVFKFVFSTEKHPALFKTRPDLFLVVTDDSGKQLYIADQPLRPTVGGVEEQKIVLER